MSVGSLIGASEMKKTPPAKEFCASCATRKARLALSTPPGPVSVMRRTFGRRRSRRRVAVSWSRPSRGMSGTGTADPGADWLRRSPSGACAIALSFNRMCLVQRGACACGIVHQVCAHFRAKEYHFTKSGLAGCEVLLYSFSLLVWCGRTISVTCSVPGPYYTGGAADNGEMSVLSSVSGRNGGRIVV